MRCDADVHHVRAAAETIFARARRRLRMTVRIDHRCRKRRSRKRCGFFPAELRTRQIDRGNHQEDECHDTHDGAPAAFRRLTSSAEQMTHRRTEIVLPGHADRLGRNMHASFVGADEIGLRHDSIDDHDTVADFVSDAPRRKDAEGRQKNRCRGIRFEIVHMDGRCIDKILVAKLPS